MIVGSIVKFKKYPSANVPGYRKDNGDTGMLINHCGTSSLTGNSGLKWVEVLWAGNSNVTKCFKSDLISIN